MSIYPVSQALIPPDWTRDPPIIPCLLIFHTAVSNAKAPGPSAPDANGLEWHFYIAEDGQIVQRRDTGEEADANYHANSFTLGSKRYGAISVETWDGGRPEENPWTPAQVTSIVRLCHLAHELDDIPLQRPAAWNGEGIGYHRQFGEWNQPYHSCPGNTRAAQFDSDIWPRVLQGDDEMVTDKDVTAIATASAVKVEQQILGTLQAGMKEVAAQNTATLLAALRGLTVDPKKIAEALAPLVNASLQHLSAEDLAAIAKAVNDEEARRQAA